MAQEPVRTKLKRALIATGAIVLVVASSGFARAADDDDDDDAPDIKFFRSVLGGLGLKGPNDSQIEYRERSPLVLPPSVDQLPPPAAEAQPSAGQLAGGPGCATPARKPARCAKKQGNRSKDLGNRRQGLAAGSNGAGCRNGGGATWPWPGGRDQQQGRGWPAVDPQGTRLQGRHFRQPVQQGRNRDREIHSRAGALQPDRPAGGLSYAVIGAALWSRRPTVPSQRRRPAIPISAPRRMKASNRPFLPRHRGSASRSAPRLTHKCCRRHHDAGVACCGASPRWISTA